MSGRGLVCRREWGTAWNRRRPRQPPSTRQTASVAARQTQPMVRDVIGVILLLLLLLFGLTITIIDSNVPLYSQQQRSVSI